MADVFISYARADLEAVERLTSALEAEGLSVWWDRRLVAGLDFVEEIERELEAARSVVVVWSKTSRRSRFVRAEALHAMNAGTLKPVSIDGAGPSPFFAAVQYEDLRGWEGDRTATPFQALTARLRGAETVAPALAPAVKGQAEGKGRISLESMLSLLAAFIAIGGIAAYFAGIDLVQYAGPYWAGAVVLALGAVTLFRTAENAAPKRARDLAASWISGQRAFTAAEAFLTLFEAVFTRRHLSVACFFRSVLATLVVYALLLLLFVNPELFSERVEEYGVFNVHSFSGLADTVHSRLLPLTSVIEGSGLMLLIILPLVNIFADYLSLWQTRKILEWSTGSLPLLLGVIFDALLTAAIFMITLPIGPMIAVLIASEDTGEAWSQALVVVPEVWRAFWAILDVNLAGEVASVMSREGSISTTTLLVACATTFITSVWLWFAVLLTPVFRLLAFTRRGISALGRSLHAQAKPIAALGYGVAALILFGAGAAKAGQIALQIFASDAKRQPFRDCANCPEMIAITAGSFWMGSPDDEQDRSPSEGPQRRIRIPSFAIGIYEVTFREWDACVADTVGRATGCRALPSMIGIPHPDTVDFGDQGWGRGLRPVITVSWEDAQAYVKWLNSKVEGEPYRLPSEAEWEFAARAGSATRFSTGDQISTTQAWFIGRDDFDWKGFRARTVPVGAFAPNAFGLHDMHGNVEEWVQDCWHEDFEAAPVDGSAWMEEAGGDCTSAVARGGSWSGGHEFLRSASRSGFGREQKDTGLGFRVARTLSEN